MNFLDDLYTDDLKEQYFAAVKDSFAKVHKENKRIKWETGNLGNLLNGCRKLLGNQFEQFFSQSDDTDNFRELILMSPKNIQLMIELFRKEPGDELKRIFEKYDFQRLKAVYTVGNIMQKKLQGRKINTLLVDSLKVAVCPYCNRNFINNREDKLGAQIDHFFNKDTYPIFAVSLYNLVPVCGNCNHLKSNKDFNVYPFLRDEEKGHEIKFDYLYKSLEELEVNIPKSSPQRENDIEQIKLREAYAIHSLDVKNMLDREVRYSNSYRKELRKLFEQEEDFSWILTDEEIDRMIYGDSIFEEDFKNIPLGKFRKNIYEEIKRLRH